MSDFNDIFVDDLIGAISKALISESSDASAVYLIPKTIKTSVTMELQLCGFQTTEGYHAVLSNYLGISFAEITACYQEWYIAHVAARPFDFGVQLALSNGRPTGDIRLDFCIKDH